MAGRYPALERILNEGIAAVAELPPDPALMDASTLMTDVLSQINGYPKEDGATVAVAEPPEPEPTEPGITGVYTKTPEPARSNLFRDMTR